MKRNPSPSGTHNLADELAELRGLDSTALKQRWRVLYRAAAPVRIGQALLLQAVAYRLQERVLGGLKSSTRRLLERSAEDNRHRRTPTEAPPTKVTPGSRFESILLHQTVVQASPHGWLLLPGTDDCSFCSGTFVFAPDAPLFADRTKPHAANLQRATTTLSTYPIF